MDTSTVTLFLALLAVVAQLCVATGLVLGIGSRWSPMLARGWAEVRAAVGPQALLLAFTVALTATLGSLYLSEVANFPPCRLCWYQRIAMYPLVALLGQAAWRRDPSVRPYVLVQVGLGGLISCYHMVVERFPTLESSSCDPLNPCSIVWVERFGYLTIPTMALSAFALIALLMVLARPQDSRR